MPGKSKLVSIADCWESYLRDVVPRDAGKVQRDEIRRAFYSGAWSLVCAMDAATKDASVTDQHGIAYFESLASECVAFKAAVKAGRA